MIWAAGLVAASALAIALWHLQRPNPPRIAISFARFIPALPPAPSGRARIALTRPRDPLALLFLLLAAALTLWALLDADRLYRAAQPEHLGLRIVLDQSHSMTVPDGSATRYTRALQRIDEVRAAVEGSEAGTTCIEIIGVAAQIGPVLALGSGAPGLPPLPEGGEPALLMEAALRPEGACVLTHVLILTDQPPVAGAPEGRQLLWDQIGAPVGNAGISDLSLMSGAFGRSTSELRIEGVTSALAVPSGLMLETPGGPMALTVHPDPAVAGQWYALAPYAGPGLYQAQLAPSDGYGGDDRAEARLERPEAAAVDWRLTALPRPTGLIEGLPGDPLVIDAAGLTPQDMSRPLLITYPGFDAAPAPDRRIGPFREDHALFGALNFDALEAALPLAWPGPLPAGFAPVMTDATGGVLIARRALPFGLILPAPRPDLPEPARSLSLTLFFTGLSDLLTLPPQTQPLVWRDPSGTAISEAWRESRTGRPAGPPADLSRLTVTGGAQGALPVWPWALAAALAMALAERLLRLSHREGRVA